MNYCNIPGGVGGMIRKDIEDEAHRLKEERNRNKRKDTAWGKTVQKGAYHMADDLERGIKGLFGL